MVAFIYQLVSNTYKSRDLWWWKKHNFESQTKWRYVVGPFSRAQLLPIMKLDKGKVFLYIPFLPQHLLGLFDACTGILHISIYSKSSSLRATCPKEAILVVSTALPSFCQFFSLWCVYSFSLEVNRSPRVAILFLPSSPTVNQDNWRRK